MEKGHIVDDRYLILKKIGSGGFATVYKCWAIRLEKVVALKTIHDNYYRNPEFVKMFHDEVSITAKLDHENIVRLLDSHENYLVMEYVVGTDLRYLLKKSKELNKPLPVEISVYIISEVLRGLQYAHSARDTFGNPLNIVHRDISPANVMVYYDGRVKLTDFGIAKAASRHIESTKVGVIKGKMSYMSPEQAAGKVDIDHRSDIFAVGVVLYELLSGKKLFEGDSELETWQKVINVKPEIIHMHLDGLSLPVELCNVLLKTLQKSPENRYQNAHEMFVDLQKFLHKMKFGRRREDLQGFLSEVLDREMKIYTQEVQLERKFIEDWTKKQEKTVISKPAAPGVTTIAKAPEISAPSPTAPMPEPIVKPAKGISKKTVITISGVLVVSMFLVIGYFVIIRKWPVWPPPITAPPTKPPIQPKLPTQPLPNGSTHAEPAENITGITTPYAEITPTIQKGKCSISSIPSGAEIYINDIPHGRTPVELDLAFGKHHIKIDKTGYEHFYKQIEIGTEKEYVTVSAKLKKLIKFSCYDKTNQAKDINAEVYIEGTDIKKTTPFTTALLPGKYKITFAKSPEYRKRSLSIEIKNQDEIKEFLEKQLPKVTIVAKDKKSGNPIQGAYILVDDKLLGKTDESGKWISEIQFGKHSITVGKGKEFGDKTIEKQFSYGSNTTLIFELLKPLNAVIIVDPTPYFDAEIYFNNEKIGSGVKKITNVSEGVHQIMIKHTKFPEGKTKTVEINKPNQEIILKISETGEIYQK